MTPTEINAANLIRYASGDETLSDNELAGALEHFINGGEYDTLGRALCRAVRERFIARLQGRRAMLVARATAMRTKLQ